MNRQQKIAWHSIIVISSVLLLTLAMSYLLVSKIGWKIFPSSLCFIGLSCIAGIGPLIFRKNKTQIVNADERDLLFELRASYIGFSTCYCYYVAVGLAILIFNGFNGIMRVKWLLPFFISGYVISEFARSIAVLVQYGWKEEKNNE